MEKTNKSTNKQTNKQANKNKQKANKYDHTLFFKEPVNPGLGSDVLKSNFRQEFRLSFLMLITCFAKIAIQENCVFALHFTEKMLKLWKI